jgi:hypothetical protein
MSSRLPVMAEVLAWAAEAGDAYGRILRETPQNEAAARNRDHRLRVAADQMQTVLAALPGAHARDTAGPGGAAMTQDGNMMSNAGAGGGSARRPENVYDPEASAGPGTWVAEPYVWIVVRTGEGSRWLAGVFAGDAELEARRLASAPHHVLMQVAVTRKGENPPGGCADPGEQS